MFSKLNGAPAQALIVCGLILVLAVPLIPSFRTARVARAQTELSQVDTLIRLDLDDLRRIQERERKEDLEAAERDRATPIDYSLGPADIDRQQQERNAREQSRRAKERARQKALDDKEDQLKRHYDANARHRTLMSAQADASGMSWHLLLLFLGNAMLLVGLLVLTLESDGVKQKIALVVLLVVMFSALSGVNLNFLASGSMGDAAVSTSRLAK